MADAGSILLVEPRAETGSYPGVSWREYGDLRERLRSIPDLIAFRMAPLGTGEPGHVQRAYGLLVSGNYFSGLRLRPVLGRFLREDEVSRPGGEPVIVVSYDYWQTRLGGDRSAIGRSIRVNDRLLTVIGVAPPRFQGTALGLNFEMWVPATLAPVLLNGSAELTDRSLRGYAAIGRLAPGATRAQAQVEFDRVIDDLAHAHPETDGRLRGEVLPFWQAPRGPQRMLAGALAILQTIMFLLLLAVCGNTANLLLARAATRQREMGVRLALGAARRRIAMLVLCESLLLAAAGAAGGVLLATWATDALRAVPIISAFPIRFQTELDGTSVAFAAALAIACGILFGLAPALHLARVDPQAAIRSGGGAAGGSPFRNALMAVEVGLALVVLLAAAMFLRAFGDARDTDPGFTREGVLLVAYDLTGKNMNWADTRDFTRRLLDRARALPAVESAAIASAVPLDIHGLPMRSFTVEGRVRSEATPDLALTNTVTPDYFRTMRIAIRHGTDFAGLADESSPRQAIVNMEFVRRFIGNGECIGRRLTTRGDTYTIAGIVDTSVSESFGEPPAPVIYLSYRDRPSGRGEIHLRTRAGAETLLAPEVERIVRDLDPTLPVYDVRTLAEHIDKNLFLRRIPARMFVVLGPALLLLAAIGIYAVVAYTVSRRTAEIGVRLALGATPRRVLMEVLADSMRVVTAGAAVGWTLTVVVALHLVRGAMHASVFLGVPALLLLVAAAASWLPARRASRVDPVVALRDE
ncbi:MAG TPA: ADOP family duplicated permease [Vicinamibacterales bacterium]|nr:ADOP family duplicated permease [Vicinamibacterales bacterium]